MTTLLRLNLIIVLCTFAPEGFAQEIKLAEIVQIMQSNNPARTLKSGEYQRRIRKWNPGLASVISSSNEQQLNQKIKGLHDASLNRERFTEATPHQRALNFLYLLENNPQNFRFIFETSLQWAAGNSAAPSKISFNQLYGDYGEAKKPFNMEVEQILKSVILDWQTKRELIFRSVLRRQDPSERRQVLREMDPRYRGGRVENSIIESANRQRMGFFTGVFNPFHPGHFGVSEFSTAQLVLDKLIVIPTPATTHNEMPEDWSHRRNMAHYDLERIQGAEVVQEKYLEGLVKSTGVGIEQIIRDFGGKNNWFQIMGADSFERFVDRGFSSSLGKPGKAGAVFVVFRPGYPVPEIPSSIKNRVYFFNPVQDLPNYPENARSSSEIRRRIAANQPITGLVSPEIERYILKHRLFVSEIPQNAQFVNFAGCHKADHATLAMTNF